MSVQHYHYQACDAGGNLLNGHLSAESEREAVAQLQARQLTPLKLKLSNEQTQALSDGRVKHADLVDFTNGLCTLVEARVPLDKALSLLEGITEKEHMKRLVVSLRRQVKEGKSLADAMELHPEVFSRLYLNLVRAGETGGILDQLLPDLAEFLETAEATRRHILSSLTYPIVLLVTGALSVLLLLVFVIPQFTAIFANVGSTIPPSAQFLLDVSAALKHYGWLIVPLGFAVSWYWRWWRKDPEHRLAFDSALLKLPLLGNILLQREVATFSRTLGALLGANIPLIRALRVARDVVGNSLLVKQLRQVEEDVRGGAGLGVSLARTRQFPLLLHQLVTVGEESGRTAPILRKLAQTFDNYVKDDMQRLVNALQPALILILGVVVGAILIIMLSAVFSMNTLDF
ncbi:MAG: type II secretion system F family protein [Pseudomonadales bacterium]|jgi:general secretion pathway protein F|nr:type II secretion system F family protein [Pseudomonadales bacterium]